jgi:hypothetical protein
MLNVNIFGNYEFADLPTIAVATETEENVYAALQEFLAAESRLVSDLAGLLADEGTNLAENFGTVTGGQLQRAGEFSRPEATRRGGKWGVAFPIYAWEDRKIYTPEFLARANLQDINADAVSAAVKDVNTVLQHLFGALTGKDNYTFDDSEWPGENAGPLTIRRLANNDASDGSLYHNGAEVAVGTAQHYKFSGSGTWGVGAIQTMIATLTAVGNGTDIVVIISENDADDVKALSGFVPVVDPKVSLLPTTQTPLVASPRAIGRFSGTGLGMGCEIQVWPHWPDAYAFGFDRSKDRPLRIRQPKAAGERGFQLVADETRGGERPGRPLVNKYWRRIMGAAVRNRMNGVMMKIHASAYSDPSLA